MPGETVFGLDQILELLPHRPPFLFVDRIVKFKTDALITSEHSIDPEAYYFKGHFPQKPIVPGVIVTDALAQTSGLLWGFSKKARGESTGTSPEIFYLAAANVKFTSPAYPNDTLLMTAQAGRNFGTLYTYTVEAVAGRKTIVAGSLTLAMMKGSI